MPSDLIPENKITPGGRLAAEVRLDDPRMAKIGERDALLTSDRVANARSRLGLG